MSILKNFSFIFALTLFSLSLAHAETDGRWFFSPTFGVGFNTVQKTYFRAGLDLGMHIDENFYAGVGGYYAAGSHPEHDREIGGGPFAGYVYPLASFIDFELREDVDYVDEYIPVLNTGNPDFYTHTQDYGVISGSYAGVHLSFGRNFGLSVGYRLVVGLSKASLADGRSGTCLGILIGI